MLVVIASLNINCGAGGGSTSVTPPPAAPKSVVITWEASTSKVIGYFVYRREADQIDYILLQSTPTQTLTYVDNQVAAGHQYAYVVTAVDSKWIESIPSEEVLVKMTY